MLVLTFQVGREPMALDIRHVREVVPRVRLQPVSGAPDWLAGVFVYRGQVVPVLDLHRLPGGGERLLGLLAAQVADIREVPDGAAPASLAADGRADLGPVVAD